MLTTRALYAGLLWAMATVILTILLGRFFCGWVCPFGSLHHFVGFLGRRGRSLRERVAGNQYHHGQTIKYYLLIFLLTAAAGSLIAHVIRIPPDEPMIAWISVIVGLAVIALLAILKLIANPLKAFAILLSLVGVWMGLGFFLPWAGWLVPPCKQG
jgi:polyferredoxin